MRIPSILILFYCFFLFSCENQYSRYKIKDEPEFNEQYVQASLKILEENIKNSPYNPEGYYRKALLLHKINQNDQAILSIDKAIEINDNNPEFYLLATQIFLDSGDQEKALLSAKNAEKAGMNNSWLFSTLANISLEKGDNVQAFDYIDKALHADPENPGNYFKKGKLFLNIEDTIQAVESFDQSLRLDSNNIELLTSYTDIAIARKQFKQAKILLNKKSRLYEPDQKFYLQTALLLYKTGFADSARTSFGHLLNLEPENFLAYNFISGIDFQKKEYDSALWYAEKSLTFKNDLKEAMLTIARVKDIKKQYYSAIIQYDKILKLDTSFAIAKRERALVQKKINNLARTQQRENAPVLPTVQQRF